MQCSARGNGLNSRRRIFLSSIFRRYDRLVEREELDQDLQNLDLELNAANSGTYGRLLQTCGKLRALPEGKHVHEKIIESGMGQNIYLANHLVSMYGKCGSLEDAHREFDRMHTRNVFSWTALMTAYAQNGHGSEALKLFKQMQQEDVQPDKITFVIALNASTSLGFLKEGKLVHSSVRSSGLESDVVVGSALIDMYGKCGCIDEACAVFERITHRNLVCWTSMVAAFAQNGHFDEAIHHYQQMQLEGLKPDRITFVTLLDACADPAIGKQLHWLIVESGLESDLDVATCLVRMYGKCGRLEDARKIFEQMPRHDLTSWNAVIAAGVNKEGHVELLHLFKQMQAEDVKPDRTTFVNILEGFDAPLADAKLLHAAIIESGLETNVGPALVRMYGNCGSVDEALKVFERLPRSSIAAWNAMLAVYAQHGHGCKAYQLFKWMLFENIKPEAATFVAIFNACAGSGLEEEATIIHAYFEEESEVKADGPVGTALVNMLIKCDMLRDAWRVFNKMQERDLGAWNAMVGDSEALATVTRPSNCSDECT